MLMVISLWKIFILAVGIAWPRNFERKKKSPSVIGREKIKAKSLRHMIFTQMNHGNDS